MTLWLSAGCALDILSLVAFVSGQYHWAGEGDMVHTSVVVPFLPLRFEVHAGPSGDHVDDFAIWLFGEVFLLWCLG